MGAIPSPLIGMSMQHTIQQCAKDGEIIVDYLIDTTRSSAHAATANMRIKTAERLAKYGCFTSL